MSYFIKCFMLLGLWLHGCLSSWRQTYCVQYINSLICVYLALRGWNSSREPVNPVTLFRLEWELCKVLHEETAGLTKTPITDCECKRLLLSGAWTSLKTCGRVASDCWCLCLLSRSSGMTTTGCSGPCSSTCWPGWSTISTGSRCPMFPTTLWGDDVSHKAMPHFSGYNAVII